MANKPILVAEDEFTSRRLLEFQLRKQGIPFDMADSGTRALELFHPGKYGLALLDEYMPGLNGSEVAQRIRQVDPTIPLLAMTGDPDAIDRLREAGFQEVLLKPLHGKAHLDIILRYLS